MRKQNMDGVAPLDVLHEPPALRPDGFEAEMHTGAIVVDARSPEAYGGAHIPGALNVGLGASFSTWAGTIVPDGARVLLVLDDPSDLWEATWQLLRIGYDLPVGWLSGGMLEWRTTARPLVGTRLVTVHELKERLGEVHVLDVRQPAEWAEGHIPGAQFITGAELPQRIDEVPRDKQVAVVCGSGFRSSAAGSLLEHEGHDGVINIIGGMGAWDAAGYETEE
jgi:hydroxyacylglutathione hydrolase